MVLRIPEQRRPAAKLRVTLGTLAILIATFSFALGVKEKHFHKNEVENKDGESRNGHSLNGQGEAKDVQSKVLHQVKQSLVSRHTLYLKAMDAHNENGFRPYKYYEENKQRRENNKLLIDFLKKKHEEERKKKTKQLTAMFKEALVTLTNHAKNDKSDEKETFEEEDDKKLTMLVQPMVIKLRNEGRRELNELKKGRIVNFSQMASKSTLKSKILEWIDDNVQNSLLSSKDEKMLRRFVHDHDKETGGKHLDSHCPFRILAKLVLPDFQDKPPLLS